MSNNNNKTNDIEDTRSGNRRRDSINMSLSSLLAVGSPSLHGHDTTTNRNRNDPEERRSLVLHVINQALTMMEDGFEDQAPTLVRNNSSNNSGERNAEDDANKRRGARQ